MPDRQETVHKSFHAPDETREFPNGRAEIITVGGGEVGRLVFEPGWRWSSRQLRGAALPVSRERPAPSQMDDDRYGGRSGRHHLPAERSRLVGDEPAVVVDWYEASNYAKSS